VTSLPPAAFAVALSLLPGCGHQRLRHLLDAAGGSEGLALSWDALRRGALFEHEPNLAAALGRDSAALVARWATAAASIDCAAVWSHLQTRRIGVWLTGGLGYPEKLRHDPEPPPILFWQGDATALNAPAAAIVGTRRCTAYGSDVARELGRDLTSAGIAVISGLALGIDGAAHEGALAGVVGGGVAPIAVVGSGLDVVYPPRHRTLWRRVAETGLIVSEAPPGAAPEAWRFPRRNRILAGLALVVVVVESHARGGSMSTVQAAVERGIAVMAVPGSVRSPSSTGTNRLLADGVAPATEAADVLVALSLEGVQATAARPRSEGAADPGPEPLGPNEAALLAAVDWTPTATEEILRRTGLSLAEASSGLVGLEVRGLVRKQSGWWERAATTGFTAPRGYTATT
jgi:DNA processing protein